MHALTWWDVFLAALAAMAPLLAVFLTFHRQNRADKKRSDELMSMLLREFPLHEHNEDGDEPLLASGLRYPRSVLK